MKKKRRRVFVNVMLVLLLVLSTACGNKQEPTATSDPAASGAPIGTTAPATSPTAETSPAVTPTAGSITPALLTPDVTQGVDVTPGIEPSEAPAPSGSVPSGAATPSPDTKQPVTPVPSSAANPGTVTPTLTTAAGKTPTKATGNTSTPSPTPSKKPGNTSTPSPTPTPAEDVYGDTWDDAVDRDDIAKVLMQKVNAYRVSQGVPAFEDPYNYSKSSGDYLYEKTHRVAKANALLGINSQSQHESGQIGTGTVYWMSSTDADVVEEIAEVLFMSWYNSKAHNANMLYDSTNNVDVAVMAVYEYCDNGFYCYAAICTISAMSGGN